MFLGQFLLLQNDVDIVLCPDPSCLNNSDELIDSAYQYLNSQSLLLEKLRKYIAIISTVNFNFNENILKVYLQIYYSNLKKCNLSKSIFYVI